MKILINFFKNMGIALLLVGLSTFCGSAKGKLFVYETDANGFNTKNYFYDSGEEVVVFDTQFTNDFAQKSIEYLRTKTKSPIKYLVITHPNPDKFNAIELFRKEGARVIASKKTVEAMKGVHEYKKYYWVNIAKLFSEETYPKLGEVQITFEKNYEIVLGNGEKILLTELGSPGVSSNQTVAFIPSLKSYVVGDLIHHKAHAWLEGGITNGKPSPDIRAWISTLLALDKLDNFSSKVYGGRGEEANLKDAVKQQIAYLEKADTLVSDYISKLGTKKSELKTDNAGKHYGNIQNIFAKTFPDYGLEYMIGYGVYGLVNSKL